MTVLLLAGTSEAQQIAQSLSEQGISAIASLAGATRAPRDIGIPTRIGGFGGAAGFRKFLSENSISAVLDATHPFAARISHRSAEICAHLGLPYCQVLRPCWTQEPGDQWTHIQDEAEAALHINPGETVFLATGRQTLDRFENLSQCRLICRQIDPPDRPFPFANGAFLVGRPPFPVEDEKELFTRLGIDWLVVKNAGGAASKTKLTAARELGLRVAMIARPEQPDAFRVETVQQALHWAGSL